MPIIKEFWVCQQESNGIQGESGVALKSPQKTGNSHPATIAVLLGAELPQKGTEGVQNLPQPPLLTEEPAEKQAYGFTGEQSSSTNSQQEDSSNVERNVAAIVA